VEVAGSIKGGLEGEASRSDPNLHVMTSSGTPVKLYPSTFRPSLEGAAAAGEIKKRRVISA